MVSVKEDELLSSLISQYDVSLVAMVEHCGSHVISLPLLKDGSSSGNKKHCVSSRKTTPLTTPKRKMVFTPRTSSTPQSLPPRKIPKKLAPTRFAKPPRSPPQPAGGLEVLAEEEKGPLDVGGGDWDMGDSGGGGWDEGVDQLMDAAAAEMDVGEGEGTKESKEPEIEV